MWAHCAVNNAAYYMYENYGSYIPSDMRLWVIDNTGKGCAAMLGHGIAFKYKAYELESWSVKNKVQATLDFDGLGKENHTVDIKKNAAR